ncbi:hypothetical protein G6F64_014604 [Rhizopus arrhizus]|uniref:Uncharacterized protein n=1 Tax=Rhizopus oryzae TaxID=64495 RepID=A0A9P6WT56_RHIOR|nr:hypothetical protein G6F64_014604 [Rhizopus arrhizus]
MRGLRADVLAPQRDTPGARRQKAEQGLEHRGLAGAVGADQRQDLARPDFQVHGIVGDQTAELARHVHGLEHDLAAWRHRLAGQGVGVHVHAAHGLLHADPARQHRPQAAACTVQQQHHAKTEDDDLEVACGIHAQDAPMRQIDAPQIAGAIERRPLQKRVHLHVARGPPA